MNNQSKQRRTNVVDDAVASTSNQTEEVSTPPQSQTAPAPYLRVIADCWEHIFDNLSFQDILVMGQTCKRMNRMAGFYIREYYTNVVFRLIGNEIYCGNVCLQPDFYPFISRLLYQKTNDFNFWSNVKSFDALKTIRVGGMLTGSKIESMQHALKNVENIDIILSTYDGDIFEKIAKYCSKLKRLSILFKKLISTNLFSQYYPTLESLSFEASKRIDDLKIFLEKHTKLKRFAIESEFLWLNRDILEQTNCQFDELDVRFGNFPTMRALASFDQLIDVLKTLYERRFYKTLQLYFPPDFIYDDANLIDTISTLP